MGPWLRLIRWKNLLIVFLTQLLVWYCLIFNGGEPGVYKSDLSMLAQMHPLNFYSSIVNFALVSLSTILIAAAGYIINDYFDIKIDVINRPGKVVLEKTIQMRHAIIAHSLLNILGLMVAGFVALHAHHVEWLSVQIVSTILLWFYSTHFKRQYITGNVVVALLTALSVIVLVVYSQVLHATWTYSGSLAKNQIYESVDNVIGPVPIAYAYAFFAFMLTWMREIVKDMEDYIGDGEQGCMTMPIKKGLQFSARFTQVIGGTTIFILTLIVYYLYNFGSPLPDYVFYLPAGYTIFFIIVPLIFWCFFLSANKTTLHYHKASKWLKVIMVSGIISIVLFKYI